MLLLPLNTLLAQVMKDIAVKVGERMLVRRATLKIMQVALQKIGIKITQRLIGKSITRWLGPLAALGVAGYAYYDTAKVAETSIEFFACEIEQSESGRCGRCGMGNCQLNQRAIFNSNELETICRGGFLGCPAFLLFGF